MQNPSDQLEAVIYRFSDLFLLWKQPSHEANHHAKKVTLEQHCVLWQQRPHATVPLAGSRSFSSTGLSISAQAQQPEQGEKQTAHLFLLHTLASHPPRMQHPVPRARGLGGNSGHAVPWFGVFQAVLKCRTVRNGKIFTCSLVFLLQLAEPRWHWSGKWNKYMQEVFSQSYLIHQKGHLNIQQPLIYIELLFMHPVNIRSNF